MKPLISVIVPVYNVERYLNRCVDSILSQTYDNLQVILINDGSTDNSAEICKDYEKRDSRILFLSQQNGGAVRARKAGINASKGEYVSFVDSDDWIEGDMFEYMVDKALHYDTPMVTVRYVQEFGTHSVARPAPVAGIYRRDGTDDDCSYKHMFSRDENSLIKMEGIGWNKLVRRDILLNWYMKVPDDIAMFEDWAWVYACVPFISSVYASDKIFYHYNKENSSSVVAQTNKNTKYIRDIICVYNHLEVIYQNHESYELLVSQLNVFALNEILNKLPQPMQSRMSMYEIENIARLQHKDVVVYGVGVVGKQIILQLKNEKKVNLKYAVDAHKNGFIHDIEIKDLTALQNGDYDLIIIAVLNESLADEITDNLSTVYNVDKNKIIWQRPIRIVERLFL